MDTEPRSVPEKRPLEGSTDDTQAEPVTTVDLHELDALVSRYSPWLYQQARHRLPKAVQQVSSPEDVVQDAWAAALPHLHGLLQAEQLQTNAILRYLTTCVINRCNALARSFAMKLRPEAVSMSQISLRASGVVSRVIRLEEAVELHETIDSLGVEDREIIVLRGIEQRPIEEVASLTGRSENGVSQRFRRACQKIRGKLPIIWEEETLRKE